MCSMIGVFTTGAMGLGISPVSGKSLVPLPAARAIAFIGFSLARSAKPFIRTLYSSPVHASTLHRLFPSAKFDEPLKRYTAWKIGGPADALLEPRSVEDLIEAAEKAREHGVPVTVLGGGTNVLVRDGGIRGLTIRLAKSLTDVEIEGPRVTADAGVLYPVLANTTAGRGLAGLEFATGIPGTVGGAVYMNAGAYGGETTEVLDWADVFRDHEVVRMENQRPGPLLPPQRPAREPRLGRPARRLHARPGDADRTEGPHKRVQGAAHERLPEQAELRLHLQTPPGDFPGRVIEAAGLKGTRVGQIEVSPVHANYLVNLGGGTAEDALKLIELVRETVREKTRASSWSRR